MNLPLLRALFFHAQSKGRKTVLVDVGPHLLETAGRRAGYELRMLAPSANLQALAAGGAQFHLSPQGGIRVWLVDKLIAAETEADCARYRARELEQAESEYLHAYLAAIGRRWDDPDQLAPAPPEAAAPREATPALSPSPVHVRLVQGLYRLVVCSLQP